MVKKIVKKASKTWRKITKLAAPLDSDKPVVIGKNPNSPSPFEAYTDNKKIYININDPKKIEEDFKKIVLPAYDKSSPTLYDIAKQVAKVGDKELSDNLLYDMFMFVHFHEQWHPLKCPNSRDDEKAITKALYDGIKEAQPNLSKSEALYKANNCKNLIWDVVLNVSFVSETAGRSNPRLDQIVNHVFKEEKRIISKAGIEHYPAGILPIAYFTSAMNSTTDIPISLVGLMYTAMSFNHEDARQKVAAGFIDDLKNKKMDRQKAEEVLKEMYKGFVSEIDAKLLKKKGIDKQDYEKKVDGIFDFASKDYEKAQNYFVNVLEKIFDTPDLRYDSLKGFIKPLAPYIQLGEKNGSVDKNTSSYGSGGGAGMPMPGAGGEGKEEGGDDAGNDYPDTSGSGGGDGDEEGEGDDGDDAKDGKGKGKGKGSGSDAGDKDQDDFDRDSMKQTLEDLMETLDGKEKNDLLGELGGPGMAGHSRGAGAPSANVTNTLFYFAADEYYKEHADKIEVKNPSSERFSIEVGKQKRWKLVRSYNLTGAEVASLNHQQIINFQKVTKLPVLMEVGNGYYKLNEYVLEETPLRSYNSEKRGIEIPDNWVLIKDSSGSMTGGPDYMGSKNPYDTLMHVSYGVAKGLDEVCKSLGKDLKFGVVDFSDQTHYSGMDSFRNVYATRDHAVKQVWLRPQCGGTHCSSAVFPKIAKDLAPGKTIYTMITDGDLFGGTDDLRREIDKAASKKDSAFVFIEIGIHSSFGMEIKAMSKHNPAIQYYYVANVASIKDKLSSVLIKYK